MKNGRYLLTGLVLVFALAAVVIYVKKSRPAGAVQAAGAGLKAKGPENAPVQIVEYSDFQCPACEKAQPALSALFENPLYKDKIRLIYRHYPLPGHRWAGLAHQAAECAHKEGRFWEYHDRLYADQTKWSGMENPMELFLGYAKELNLPLENFGLCLASPEIRQHVLDDRKKGDEVRLQSTPTFFINGERFVGAVELQGKGIETVRSILGLKKAPEPAASAAPAASPAPETTSVPAA